MKILFFSGMITLIIALSYSAFPDDNPVFQVKQKGISLAHIHREELGYGSEECRQVLERLIGLGVEWIALTPFGYQGSLDDPCIRLARDDITDRKLIQTIHDVHSRNMKVFLKPHIWSWNFSNGKWRGDIVMADPGKWDAWFSNYRKFIIHYARLAEAHQVELLCVGLEYLGATRYSEEKWRDIIREIRTVYTGKLTYGANWWGEIEQIQFWDALDFIGVQWYFPLTETKNPTLEELMSGCLPHLKLLKQKAKTYKKPVLFTEIGFRSVTGASRKPWDHQSENEPINQREQQFCYEALFRMCWDQPWFAGMYWWKYYTADRITGRRRREEFLARDFTPRGKLAEQTLQNWYRGSAGNGSAFQ